MRAEGAAGAGPGGGPPGPTPDSPTRPIRPSWAAAAQVRQNHGHCLEGALVGAYVLGLHGQAPRLVDLRAGRGDYDHVVRPPRAPARSRF